MKQLYKNLPLDERLPILRKSLADQNLELVLVKGIVWNRGRLLAGADLDFYLRRDGEFKDYDELSCDRKKSVEQLFSGVLISPRKTDIKIDQRVKMFYVDAEMSFDEYGASVDFANYESKRFFEEGYFDCPDDFFPSINFVRFILNRFLEESGQKRTLSPRAYQKSKESLHQCTSSLYAKILSSFLKKNNCRQAPASLPYEELVLQHFSEGGSKEDVIFIKPLNKTYKNLPGDLYEKTRRD